MPTPTIITIHENALTSDTLEKAPKGYHFTGHNGSVYHLTYYTYANEWGDKDHHLYGRTLESVLARYEKETGRLQDKQLIDDDYTPTTEELAWEIDYTL